MFKYQTNASESLEVLSKHILKDGYNLILDLENSNSYKIKDKITGKEFIDFFTCFASMPLGMNHPKINNDDFKKKIGSVALNKIANSDLYTEEFATFVNTFFEIAVPKEFKYSFFISGGALAVENALKTAFDWKVRKNIKNGKGEKGTQIIHFRQAFHGRSGYTLSLTNTLENKIKYFPKFDWPRVTNPKLSFPTSDSVLQTVEYLEQKAINEIKLAFENNKDDIAGIIIEPIQGEGGDNHFRPEFFKELKNICEQNEALLIFDEVQTGVGITGTMWAYQQLGTTPDILCFGKKMQVCGIIAGDKLDEVENHVFKESSRINSTWGGNIVDMVRATKYLEIIKEDNLLENAKIQGEYLKEKLSEIQSEHIGTVRNVRGMGLFVAFDLPKEIISDFLKLTFEKGLIILSCGENSIRFRPALNITSTQIDEGIEIIKSVINELV